MPPPASSVRAEAAALRSSTAYVQDLETSTVLFAKNENVVRPIASISKLMTAVVVVDANQPMNEMLEITDDDIDGLKHTTSRLRVGTRLSRGDMLHLALMSSENRAANALGRNYPGGLPAFVAAMNAKAQALGMTSTRFIEPTGLSSDNVSSPHDLARLLRAASQRPLIHRYSTDTEYDVEINNRTQTFRNTNLLVRKPDWDIKVSKTGFINEAGECRSCWPASTAATGHRAAGLAGQARALATRYASAASCRAKSRWRRPSPAAEAGAIARHRKGPIR